jgi:NCS2 family nucleobase:cation symporter-2
MFMSGIQVMMSSKPDMAMTFVIGLSLAFGLSVDVLPSIFSDVPSWARPILGSSLTVATLLAIGLHQLFRLGRPPPAEDASPLH